MLAKPIDRCAWKLRGAAVPRRDEIRLGRRVANQRAFSEPTAYRLSGESHRLSVARGDRPLDEALEHPEPDVLPFAVVPESLTCGDGALRRVSAHARLHEFVQPYEPRRLSEQFVERKRNSDHPLLSVHPLL